MKNVLLTASLVINLGFLVIEARSLWHSAPQKGAPQGQALAVPRVAAAPALHEEPLSTAASAPFRWSQLSSADDAQFIANLRSVGCPEPTIRDILTAAVGRRYDEKRQRLLAQRTEGTTGAAEFRDANARLWEEQNELVASLFETPGTFGQGPVRGVKNVTAAAGGAPAVRLTVPLRYDDPIPLAMRDPDPSWGLTEAQLETWNSIADKFVDAVGGANQDPKDPAYRERWKAALPEANEQLQIQFGAEMIEELQRKVRASQ